MTEVGALEAAAVRTFGDDHAGLGLVDGQLVAARCVEERLDAASAHLIAHGVQLVAWGVDPATNSVSVGDRCGRALDGLLAGAGDHLTDVIACVAGA